VPFAIFIRDNVGLHSPSCFKEQDISHCPQPVHLSGSIMMILFIYIPECKAYLV